MMADAEEYELRRNNRRKAGVLRSLIDPLNDLSESEFEKRYRLSKDAVRFLDELLCRETELRSTQRVKSEFKILTALSFFATGSYQRILGEEKHVTQRCTSKYIDEVTNALNEPVILQKFIQFPQTLAQRNAIKLKFFQKYGVPGIMGCIDGTHIRILKPALSEHLYYCSKYYHSLNVQINQVSAHHDQLGRRQGGGRAPPAMNPLLHLAVHNEVLVPILMYGSECQACDSDCKIIAINAKYGGASHDAFIWEGSRLNQKMESISAVDSSCWLLGDSGYPLLPWLLTPYLNAEPGSLQARYNDVHCRARSVVDVTIGRLKNRWRCCLGHCSLHYKPAKCAKIVHACCVLHNLAIMFGVPEPDDEIPIVEPYHRVEPVFEIEEDTHNSLRGRAVRNMLMGRLN